VPSIYIFFQHSAIQKLFLTVRWKKIVKEYIKVKNFFWSASTGQRKKKERESTSIVSGRKTLDGTDFLF
jgi:hypothetical protein